MQRELLKTSTSTLQMHMANDKPLTKAEIDLWVSENYMELKTNVINILAPKGMIDYADDLISNAYLHICNVTASTISFLKSVFVNYCHKQAIWSHTNLKKEIKSKETLFEFIPDTTDESEMDSDVFEYLKKIGAIEMYKRKITNRDEKRMFEIYMKLHSMHGKVSKSILAKHLKLPQSTATYLIKNLLEGIREVYVNEFKGELGSIRGTSKFKNK